MPKHICAVVLAGGQGSRLRALTADRAKPAVEFAGKWRIIDFVLNNLVNSGIDHIMVLTQYKASSLIRHLEHFWITASLRGPYISVLPAQQGKTQTWYQGTADAVFQNLPAIMEIEDIEIVGIFAGDHIYKIDVSNFAEVHTARGARFSICAHTVPVADASGFGIIEVDGDGRIVGFEEKPAVPKEIPSRPGYCLASTGNYLVEKEYLVRVLGEDNLDPASSHDFGKDIIPRLVASGEEGLYVYELASHRIPGERGVYWRDVGTVRAFLDAHLDLVGFEPELNLYNRHWPMRTFPDNLPPAKIVRGPLRDESGACLPHQFYILSGGCILDTVSLDGVTLGREVVLEGCRVSESVIFSRARVESGAILRRCIVDEGVLVPAGVSVGLNPQEDMERGLYVEDGITLIPKNFKF